MRNAHSPSFFMFAAFLAFGAIAAAMLPSARAGEDDAVAISRAIQKRHAPFGGLLDPMYKAALGQPGEGELVRYTRGADSAIWTGHYLAAEAYRYAVTRSPEALANARRALKTLQDLVAVTRATKGAEGMMARLVMPADWKYLPGIAQEEASHGLYDGVLDGKAVKWLGGTSRDQYSGVFFGLGAAYDMIDDAGFKRDVAALVTALLQPLLDSDWKVRMPKSEHGISTVFWGRADQQLSFLQVGAHVNRAQFYARYDGFRKLWSKAVYLPLWTETFNDHDSYFKFNLDMINLYNLIRLEYNPAESEDKQTSGYKNYMSAYNQLWKTLDDHGNAHFQMIDRVIRRAPDARRDASTCAGLDALLERGHRDVWVDLRSRLKACGNKGEKACAAIPVRDRVHTDFVWQRSPFLLFGGGAGTIESSGVDYILPYWMARYYRACN